MFEENQLARRFKHFAGRADHVVEPVGVLGGVRSWGRSNSAMCRRIFVAVDHQRHLGDIAFVEPIASDASLSRPAPQVPGSFAQAVGEFFGLSRGFAFQTAKRWRRRSRSLSSGSSPGSCCSRWTGAVELKVGAGDLAVEQFATAIGRLPHELLQVLACRQNKMRPVFSRRNTPAAIDRGPRSQRLRPTASRRAGS